VIVDRGQRPVVRTAAAAAAFAANPALLRLRELEALKDLAKASNARIYIGFDKYGLPRADGE